LAGSSSFVADARDNLVNEGVLSAINEHNTPMLFDWMVRAFSFQGIADAIAADYMDKHGALTWGTIAADLDAGPACPKLQSYWQFHDCGYRKGSGTCNEPELLSGCPLPKQPLRNGRLNQTAYSLFLFIRDVAHGDFVEWLNRQLAQADDAADPRRLETMCDSLTAPLPARCQPSVWGSLLPAKRLCRHYPGCLDQDRCPAVQPNIPASLSPVRAARDLAVLRPRLFEYLQRQPY
jgi:hypothetical protein